MNDNGKETSVTMNLLVKRVPLDLTTKLKYLGATRRVTLRKVVIEALNRQLKREIKRFEEQHELPWVK